MIFFYDCRRAISSIQGIYEELQVDLSNFSRNPLLLTLYFSSKSFDSFNSIKQDSYFPLCLQLYCIGSSGINREKCHSHEEYFVFLFLTLCKYAKCIDHDLTEVGDIFEWRFPLFKEMSKTVYLN